MCACQSFFLRNRLNELRLSVAVTYKVCVCQRVLGFFLPPSRLIVLHLSVAVTYKVCVPKGSSYHLTDSVYRFSVWL